ncbi:MAG: polysaccharide deacetylase family protein [Deltaproteobacteria bacterium]|jgi:peptidoglycan/xylan/chitin deacetylase (PgdA/CDA1 family)|nr:polysaccharide deacetylase family protein [Deltaproteobacteria bacterium]
MTDDKLENNLNLTIEDNPAFKLLQNANQLDEKEIIFRHYVNKIIGYIIYYSGLIMALRQRDCKKGDLAWRILKYEKILTPEAAQNEILQDNITLLEDFKLHLEFLKEKCQVIPFRQLLLKQINGENIPPNTVVLTFDKGHQSIYTNALPLLKQYNLPATLFIPTIYIGSSNMLWYEKLLTAFQILKNNNIPLDFPFLKDFELIYNTFNSKINFKTDWNSSLITYLRTLDINERYAILHSVLEVVEKITAFPQVKSFMSWKEVELAFQDGFDIGTMGHGYQYFRELSPAELEEELKLSVQALLEHKIEPLPIICPPDQDELFPNTRAQLVKLGVSVYCGGTLYWNNLNSKELGIYYRRTPLRDLVKTKPELAMQLWNLKLLN